MHRLIFSCLFAFFFLGAYAQKRDTVVTAQALVEAERISRLDMIEIDPSENKSYDDIIFNAPINFRSGGLNDFAAVSFRGAGINQTKVLWNGIPLNSALSGIADVSLLRSDVSDRVRISTMGDGALLGDQAVGGMITVADDLKFGTGWKAKFSSHVASFTNLNFNGRLRYADSNSAYYVGGGYAYGLNDYKFPNPNNQFWLNPTNFNGKQQSGNIQVGIARRTPKAIHKFNYWNNKRYRGLSPLANSTSDSSFLIERFHRLALNSVWDLGNWKGQTTAGFTSDFIDYENPKYDLRSGNHFNQYIFNTKWLYRTWSILTDFNYSMSDDAGSHFTWLTGLTVDKFWDLGTKHRLFTTARLVGFLGEWRVVPSISYRYSLHQDWVLTADASGVFRNPTINELYFVPGGNPDLKAEKGWNYALGLKLQNERPILRDFKLSLYSRNIQNWVLWYGSFIFSPYNVGRVWSRGVELDTRWTIYERQHFNTNFLLNAGYVMSTLSEAYEQVFKRYEGVQLPYTPTTIVNANLVFHAYDFGLYWRHHFQSRRSATLDPNWYLNGFYLMDIEAFYDFHTPRNQFTYHLSVGVKNVTNTYYQYILNRPMPGRNFFVNFSVKI